jgi:hypothetical protein
MRPSVLICLVLLVSPFCAHTAPEGPVPLQKPGNIQASLNRDSVNHIVGFVVPILCYTIFGGGDLATMNINSKISSWWGSVEIVKINFIPIDPFTQASLEWNKDGESVHLNIQNVTMAAHIDVRVWIAHMIPMWGANFHVKDLNMNFDLSTSDVYNVYPQLHITPKLDALDIDFDFFYITWFIKWFVKPSSILPMLEDAITSGIQSLNEAWRNP